MNYHTRTDDDLDVYLCEDCEVEVFVEAPICVEHGCNEVGRQYEHTYMTDSNSPPLVLCDEHAKEAGYCFACGVFDPEEVEQFGICKDCALSAGDMIFFNDPTPDPSP